MIEILAMALNFEVIGACSPKPLLSKRVQTEAVSVGEVSIEVLNKWSVPYLGTERGFNSMYNYPNGNDTLEIISNTEMRSYGWCFEVDGKIPESYPDEVYLDQSMSSIKWFYGFAHYKNGQWVSQCEPAYKQKPKFICK